MNFGDFPAADQIAGRLNNLKRDRRRRTIRAAIGIAILWVSAVLLASAISSFAHAQDKTFTLIVTAQDLQVMSAALDELPRKISQPVVEKLQKQLIPQMQPPTPPVAEEKK